LMVAAVLAMVVDDYGRARGVLAVPGAAALALVLWLRLRVPDPARYETAAGPSPSPRPAGEDADLRARPSPPLPAKFWAYCAFTATTMVGFATFGVLSYHMVTRGI